MSDNPLEYRMFNSNKTQLIPYFSTNTVEIHKEEEAYSFSSLIADVGGVLGMFIGFNFLTILDHAVIILQKLMHNMK